MEKWLGHKFVSSCETTPEFKAFSRDLKKALKKAGGDEFKLVKFSRGHFYCSGFFESKKGTYIYFSTGDVRFLGDRWYKRFLVRKAKNVEDYTGGINHEDSLQNLEKNLRRLE